MSLGVYPSQKIIEFIELEFIKNAQINNIQPSTLDLTISDIAYRIKGIYLPQPQEMIRDIIKNIAIEKHDLNKPLICKEVYLIKLNEEFNLPNHVYGYTNNKSSSGRVNLQTRLIVNNTPSFDLLPKGYKGEAWIIATPQSFNIKITPGTSINQLLLKNADFHLKREDYITLNQEKQLLYTPNGDPINLNNIHLQHTDGITLSINLDLDICGYKCTPSKEKTLDFNNYDHNPLDFFTPIEKNESTILRKEDFYIFSTYEYIRIPEDYAVEMVAYDLSKGEFRTHYAGFFDPGFGYGEGNLLGTPAVLEIIPNEDNFYIRHKQPICKFKYEPLTQTPHILYGKKAGSHYQNQRGPRLSKHFKLT